MTLRISLGIASAVALATAVAHGQTGSTGALPPVEAPATDAGAPPTESATPAPTAAPTTTAPATAPPAAAPAPGPQPAYPGYPPPGYAPAPQPAWGYPPPPPQPPPPRPVRSVSLTFSPIHLIMPIVEVTGEVRIVDHLGIAALGGYGTVSAETTSSANSQRFDAYELGGQVAWYPSHEFDGLEVGAEFLYVNVSADNIDQSSVSGVADGWALGPMVGYKLLTDGGFTFVAQGGVQHVQLSAQASDNSGSSSSASDTKWIPLLNLNIGWSF